MKTSRLILFGLFVASLIFIKKSFANLDDYNPKLPMSLTYQVTLGPVSSDVEQEIKLYSDFIQKEEVTNGWKYNIGKWESQKKAEFYKRMIEGNLSQKCEVKAYFQKKSISNETAAILFQNQNKYDKIHDGFELETISVEELNLLMDLQNYRKHIRFAVQTNHNADVKTIELMQQADGFSAIKTDFGLMNFVSGNFQDYRYALDFRNKIVKDGAKDIFIAAYIDDDRISIEKAKSFCEKIDEKIMVYSAN